MPTLSIRYCLIPQCFRRIALDVCKDTVQGVYDDHQGDGYHNNPEAPSAKRPHDAVNEQSH